MAQPRRLALLAVLGTAREPVARDKLVALLWPESAPDKARHLLADNVYVVNRELAESPIRVVGDAVRLDPAAVASDVTAFEDALARGDREEGVRLYAGPFLDGFHLKGSHEFEEWARGERERLARLYREALRALAEGARTPEVTAAWWHRLVASDPCDARWRLGLMDALAAAGNRAGALAEARAHAAILAAEFEAGPDPAVEALAVRLRQGALPAPGREERAVPVPLPGAPPVRPAPSRARRLAVVGAGLVVALPLLLARPWASSSLPEASRAPRIAVLPFEVVGGGEEDSVLALGITYDVVTRISQMSGLSVLALGTVQRGGGAEGGATHLLDGSVQRRGDRVRIHVQMIDARTREHLWAERYDRGLGDIFAVESEVAGRVASALSTALSADERRRVERQPTGSLEAYMLYVQGRHVWNQRTREAHERAIRFFERAIETDPAFASAYSGLADAHFLLALSGHNPEVNYGASERAARRALELDPLLAEAHTSMSMTEGQLGDWAAAGRSLARAIELNPSYATARQWHAHHLARLGRIEEAVGEIRRAHELDPRSVTIALNLGRMLFYARDYGAAVEAFARTLDLDPGSAEAHLRLGSAYGEMGRWEDARQHIGRALELLPGGSPRADAWATLAVVEAHAGRAGRALELARAAEADGANPFLVGLAHAALGNRDPAFRWLERVEWKYSVRGVRADPRLDPLRDDPRFAMLSARIDREFGG